MTAMARTAPDIDPKIHKDSSARRIICAFCALPFMLAAAVMPAKAVEMEEFPVVKLRSLDKVTARTMTFEGRVGSTLKFGDLYIKIQACRKTPPIEQPEAASFLQVWEIDRSGEPVWVFSGWMYASSPALSAMDHPIYDVWVLDCLPAAGTEPPNSAEDAADTEEDQDLPEERQEGVLPETAVPDQPDDIQDQDL